MQRSIEEIKDEIIEFYFYATTVEGKFFEDNFIEKLDKLIETVATLQREKCAKEAKTIVYEFGFPDESYSFKLSAEEVYVDKNSILNAKL